MPKLFNTLTINKLTLNNRFVRSATMDNMADNGMVSDLEMKLYEDLGQGEIGLIFSHGLFPTMEGKCSPRQLSVHTNDAIPSLSRLVDVVHRNGGKIAAQILHGGWMCSPEVTGMPPAGPSAVIHPRTGLQVRELSSDEVHGLVDSYIQAARRIIEAGFDGIQLHSAHSWILSAFLSPATNKREDEWGGSNEKRVNLVAQICRGIRQMAGPDFPVMVKLGIKDYHPEGKAVSEGVEQARILEASGVDAIEVSEGLEENFFHHIRVGAESPYYLDECREVKKALSVPVMLVGGMRKLSDMQMVLDSNAADAISMCRPFIMNPYLVKNFKEGLAESSGCTSCNECIAQMEQGQFQCVLV
jgi:2,4-dienoyl-CoA reductase-like NADH-dependent reductase (Old Yellow Enzyme family)